LFAIWRGLPLQPSLLYLFHSSVLTCAAGEPLLNGANPVPHSYFTASSEFGVGNDAYLARLDGSGSWWAPTNAERSAIPPTLFLQVKLVPIYDNIMDVFAIALNRNRVSSECIVCIGKDSVSLKLFITGY